MTQSEKPFISDTPQTDPELDGFKRLPFAQRVAKAIASRNDPDSIVIGIYGAWGEGKTTLLHFIDKELKKNEHIIPVWFNPWRFEDEIQLLRSFFKTLADAINKSLLSKKQQVGEWLKEYGAGLLGILSLKVSDPATGSQAELSLRDAAKEIGSTLSSVELDELRNRIGKLLQEEQKRIVILMDDIDRLDKTEIQAVFKLIKLSADFANTVYVLGFDEEIVSSSLAEKYATGKKKEGRRFLEKIVQVPLYIPKADSAALRELVFNGVTQALEGARIELTEKQQSAFVQHFEYFRPRLQTPRIAKRYINASSFALPIFKGEINPIDVLLLEGIRVFYPKVFVSIRDNFDVFVGARWDSLKDRHEIAKRNEPIIADSLKELTAIEKEAARALLGALFPRTQVKPFPYREDDDYQRVSAREYLRRFFSYAIPEDDVSDIEIDELIESAKNADTEILVMAIKEIIGAKGADAFIGKLQIRAKRLSADTSAALAPAVARFGDAFSRPKKEFIIFTVYYQAAKTVFTLLENIPESERFTVAKSVLESAEPLTFAVECLRQMMPREGKEDKSLFSQADRQLLGKTVADRIRHQADKELLYIKYPLDAQLLFSTWAIFGSKTETNEYIERAFEDNLRTDVVEFLKCYLPVSWHNAMEQYESIKQVVDPEMIYNTLLKVYGYDVGGMTYDSNSNVSREQGAVGQFLVLYRRSIEMAESASE